MAITWHSGRRGFLGFLTYITGSDSVSRGGVIPAFVPVGSDGLERPTGATPATAPFSKIANNANIGGGNPTYVATGVGYGGYATPTDMLTIVGSASKTILITNIYIGAQATAGTLMTFYLTKRSTANAGGTATQPAIIPHDSTNPAASAVVNLYSAAPTPGTALGDIHLATVSATVMTNAAALFGTFVGVARDGARQMTDLRQPVILRGVGESLSVNLKGAAIPAGFVMNYIVEWVEI